MILNKDLIAKILMKADFGQLVFLDNSNADYENNNLLLSRLYFENKNMEKIQYTLRVEKVDNQINVDCDAILNLVDVIKEINK